MIPNCKILGQLVTTEITGQVNEKQKLIDTAVRISESRPIFHSLFGKDKNEDIPQVQEQANFVHATA